MTVVEAWPGADEVVIACLPHGSTVRVHHGETVREYHDGLANHPGNFDVRFSVVIPGSAVHIGWAEGFCQYLDVEVIRYHKHRDERQVWRDAVKAARRCGMVCLQLEQRDYYGRTVWRAVRFREGGQAR